MKVFIDTNIMLDVLVRRDPHLADSLRIWGLAESGKVSGFISAISLPNIYYILRRHQSSRAARKAVGILRDIFHLVSLDAQIVNQATDSDIDDFEDAIQFFGALRAGAAYLITRNTRDFPSDDIPVQTPGEFLATRFTSED